MPQNGQRKSAGSKSRKNQKKVMQFENKSMNIEYSNELPVNFQQKIKIYVDEPEVFRRIDVAVMDPFGRGRILRGDRLNGGYVVSFNTKKPGIHNASVAAYGRKGFAVVNKISFKVTEPIQPATSSPTKKAATGKQKQLKVPSLPNSFKAENIKTWPNSSTYSQAFQNLGFSVSKSYDELRNGSIEKNPNVKYTSYIFGSGNFGTVFKLNASGKNYAIKCFTRGSPGLAERYFYIGHYISSLKLPFLVDFQYLPGALRLLSNPKQYYPLLKMEWIVGTSLNAFISHNLKNSSKLLEVANGILDMVSKLQSNGMAHGDLSGDNILVDDSGNLRLIDYDGMFVPPFSKRKAPEKGHDNFQHPDRNEHFSSNLDNFSLLVIYTSLLAISHSPKLWDYNEGDGDKLIFSATDFKDPSKSELFKEITKKKGRIGKLGRLMIESLGKDPLWAGSSPAKIKTIR